MSFFNRLIATLLAAVLIAPVAPLQAKNKKGDKFYAQGRIHEVKKEWDAALEDYEKALSEDPAEMLYQMAQQKATFQASEMHVDRGLKLRSQGQLGEALLEFQKAYAINPGAAITSQELRLTQEMIDRERQRVMQTGKESTPQERALTPVEEMKKQELDKINRILPVPELQPLHPELMDLKMSGQRTKVIYETIGKLAGINVLWDPEYQPPAKDAISVDFQHSNLEEALDYVSVITKSFWKALSPNTIFITNDNANKRRDYEEQVTKVFYLQNVMLPAELQEIVNVVRTAADINRVFPYNSQFALVVRGEADRVELAGKLIHDLDRPKSEVVVDIYVMEASTVFSRQITAALASTGLNVPLNFSPRSGIQLQGGGGNSSTTTTGTTTTGTPVSGVTTPGGIAGVTPGTSSTSGTLIPAANLGRLSSADWATTLPSALLQAAMSNANTKVLQAPQLRAVDMGKATMKIGERQPTASGSFQPGIGGVGINPLVNTQFTYIDVGVNIEMTARVHDNNEVSMHISLDISNITGSVNLGGIDEPIIGQRKIDHDLRMREGEVALLGGLINQQDNKTVTGIPGLSSIPLLKRLFTGESVDHNKDELMIILIPHIVRRPEITPDNIRAIAVGNAQTISLRHAPRPSTPAPSASDHPLPPSPAVPAAGVPGVAGIIPGETKSEPSAPKAEPAAPANPNRIVAQPATTLPPATAPPLPPGIAPPPTGGVSPAAPLPPGATTTTTSPAAPAPGAGRVYFNQPQADVAVGSNFVVSVVLEGGSDVAQAPLQFSFDPKLLRLNDVTAGQLMSADGQQAAFSKNIQNDAGQAAVQLSRPPGAPGITVPSGILVNLSFQAVGRGTATVSMPGAAVRNSVGQVVAGGNAQMIVNIK